MRVYGDRLSQEPENYSLFLQPMRVYGDRLSQEPDRLFYLFGIYVAFWNLVLSTNDAFGKLSSYSQFTSKRSTLGHCF